MADAQTMQAYADNIAAYKTLVDGMPSNPHLERFINVSASGRGGAGFWLRCRKFCRSDA